jgi:hypothetical protein
MMYHNVNSGLGSLLLFSVLFCSLYFMSSAIGAEGASWQKLSASVDNLTFELSQ